MALILQTGYEDAIRTMLGVKETELPNSEINQPMILGMSEAQVIKRVPKYLEITDTVDTFLLQNAVMNYVCYLLCPGMVRRVNVEVTTIDVKWKKDRVDWSDRALQFLSDYELGLSKLTNVDPNGYDHLLMGKAKGASSIVVNG